MPSYKKKTGTVKLAAFCAVVFGLTLASSVTATFAWYTLADYAVVRDFSFLMNETAELEMGAKPIGSNEIDWEHGGKGFDSTNLADYFVSYRDTEELYDVSSMFESEWRDEADPAFTLPLLRAPYASAGEVTTMTEVATDGFYQFEFYFRAKDSDMSVFLSPIDKDGDGEYEPIYRLKDEDNARSARSIAANRGHEDDEEYISEIYQNLSKVTKASRISFYSSQGFRKTELDCSTRQSLEGDLEYVTSNTMFAGPLSIKNANDGYYDTFVGVDGIYETVYGEYTGEVEYSDVLTEDTTVPDGIVRNSFIAKSRAGTHKALSVADATYEETEAIEQLLYDPTLPDYDEEVITPLLKLKAGETERLVITVYLEGWDTDMVDAIGSGRYELNLGFTGLIDSGKHI